MPIVTIVDGHSGSGKTALAERIARESGAQILRLDALYPGWDGLAAGSAMVVDALRDGWYRRYDWSIGDFAEKHMIDRSRPLVIEGCGSLTRANIAAAKRWAGSFSRVHTIWLECSAETRRQRALERDGEMFRPHWQRWADQERIFFAITRPIALAVEIVHTDFVVRQRG